MFLVVFLEGSSVEKTGIMANLTAVRVMAKARCRKKLAESLGQNMN